MNEKTVPQSRRLRWGEGRNHAMSLVIQKTKVPEAFRARLEALSRLAQPCVRRMLAHREQSSILVIPFPARRLLNMSDLNKRNPRLQSGSIKVFAVLLCAVAVNAPVLAQTAQLQDGALRDARRLAELLADGDGDGAARMIHPQALAAMGGTEAVAAVLTAGPRAARDKGITIEVTVPSPPEQIERVGRRLFAGITARTRLTSGVATADVNGFWLCVSEDGGAHWSFVVFQDAVNARAEARTLFPEGTGGLVFPNGTDN